MFQNIFSFEGRIRRLEYGLSFLIYLVYVVVITNLLLVLNLIDLTGNQKNDMIQILALLPGIWFTITQSAKRCHDVGRSGWWQLVPFYGIVLLFIDGDIGGNEYGPNPKGLVYEDDPLYQAYQESQEQNPEKEA